MWAKQRVRTGDYDWFDIYNAKTGESCILDYDRKISIHICSQEAIVCDPIEKKSIRQLLEEHKKLLAEILKELKQIYLKI